MARAQLNKCKFNFTAEVLPPGTSAIPAINSIPFYVTPIVRGPRPYFDQIVSFKADVDSIIEFRLSVRDSKRDEGTEVGYGRFTVRSVAATNGNQCKFNYCPLLLSSVSIIFISYFLCVVYT